ncbi:hypothetical protein GCM10008024_05770 [Allgaiera indica]|nr:flagellar hook-length control protein FliK [Allgaiera indica]GHD99228.1 hypothetical protein GCM10008024_05770 [Allgaiera indica]
MPRTPTNAPPNLLTQLGAGGTPGAPSAAGKRDAPGRAEFQALLPAQGGTRAAASSQATDSVRQDARAEGAGAAAEAGISGGLSRKGASAAQLVALKVSVAGGLRTLEAETMQAIRAALASGDRAKASAILKAAAQVVGAMLGGMDGALGTNAVDRIAAALAASKGGAAGAPKPGADLQKGDPLTQAQAMFALVAQALGLVRPAVATGAPGGVVSPRTAERIGEGHGLPGAEAASATGGTAAAQSSLGLLETLARAGQMARSADGVADPAVAAVGKVGPGKSGGGADVRGHGAAEAVKAAAKRAPDPMALLAQSGAGAGGADGRAAALLAAAGNVPVPAHLSVPVAPLAAAMPGSVQALAPSPQAFAGMLGDQIRAARPSEGVTRVALHPRGLGEIQIDMKRDGSGRLNVVLRAENPLVLAALRNDHLRLSQMFASATPGPQPVLDFEAFAGRDGQGGQQRPKRAARAAGALGGPEPTDTAQLEDGTARRQDRIGRGALDIRT